MLPLSEITKCLGSPVFSTNLGNEKSKIADCFAEVCIDSRKVQTSNLFLALRGSNYDGHDFIQEAVIKGATGIICEELENNISVPQWVVPDTLQALTSLAIAHRKHYSGPVIALTGSNGKTTVKEMISKILPKPSLATFGNLNNHIGVPLNVLKLDNSYQAAVFELGANHLHEIEHTVNIVRPDVALINNIGPAHMEGFGSIEGVATAKGEIYEGLSSHGTAIVNEDDVFSHYWDKMLEGKKVLRFSVSKQMDIYAKNVQFNAHGFPAFQLVTERGIENIALHVPGMHNVSNAVAAAACAVAIGIDTKLIAKGLNAFSGVNGRMTYYQCKGNIVVIDDTYNANLRSTLMALEVLAKYPGERIFVFGDMGELGDYVVMHHQEVGAAARSLGIDKLFTCGVHSQATADAFGNKAKHFSSKKDLLNELMEELDTKDITILVKGSRKSAMEQIVQELITETKRTCKNN